MFLEKRGKSSFLKGDLFSIRKILDAIISVGYRLKSKRETKFRQGETKHLKDDLIKGYAINQKILE